MSLDRLSRRGFVVAGAAAAAAALLPAEAQASKKKKAKKDPASDLVNVAIIGAGGMGALAATTVSRAGARAAMVWSPLSNLLLYGQTGYRRIERRCLERVLDAHAAMVIAGPGPGHNAWQMVSTALVLFMSLPGLALFYGGLVRSKNVLSVLSQVLGITAVSILVWVGWGYSLAFAEGNAAVGGLSKLGLAGVDGDSAWAVPSAGQAIPELLFAAFQRAALPHRLVLLTPPDPKLDALVSIAPNGGADMKKLDDQLARVRARLKSMRALERQLLQLRSRCGGAADGQPCGILHELVSAAHGEACVCHAGTVQQ